MCYHNIILAIDNDQTAQRLFKKLPMLSNDQSNIYVVNVISYPDELLGMNGVAAPIENEDNIEDYHIQKHKDFVINEIKKAHLEDDERIHPYVVTGDPRQVLSHELPDELAADLILLGQNNEVKLSDAILLGSTTKYVTHHAPCDVLLVH